MKAYSLRLRIWHWLHALTVFGSLGTFFLRKTFLSWRANTEILMAKLADLDIVVTAEQAKALAKAVRAPMWEWHIILGCIFVVLVLWRLIMIFREGSEYDTEDTYMRWVYRAYKVIYTVLVFMAISGIIMIFYQDIGLSKDNQYSPKEIHELIAWVVVSFVTMHITGVFVADDRDQKGMISKMVSG